MDNLAFATRVAQGTWLVPITRFDRRPTLTEEERAVLAEVLQRGEAGTRGVRLGPVPETLNRLYEPLDAALTVTRAGAPARSKTIYLFLRQIQETRRLYWAWTADQWLHFFNANPRLNTPGCERRCGQHLIGVAYLLTGYTDFQAISCYRSPAVLAARVFGRDRLEAAARRMDEALNALGYRRKKQLDTLKGPLGAAMLRVGSPRLEDITTEVLAALLAECTGKWQRQAVTKVSYALFSLGITERALLTGNQQRSGRSRDGDALLLEGVPSDWAQWCRRWLETATQSERTRRGIYRVLLQAGRWLGRDHPEVTSPDQWTRETAVAYVAMVDRQRVGEWSVHTPSMHAGEPLRARTKAGNIAALRTFFLDCQGWGWLPRRFDPRRYLVTPRSVTALIAPQPRVIDDEVWVKLLQAGLTLAEADVAGAGSGQTRYPFAMVRAVALTWLLGGLRADELRRVRLGCIRWQDGTDDPQQLPSCWLDVPPNKTGPAFAKPVDALLGEAIEAWERERPPQSAVVEAGSGECVHYLFSYHGMQVGVRYLNETLIPLLCHKAGIPQEDTQGRITSHRARATIASQLANAPRPMTLLALMDWLGHRTPSATLHYVKATPLTLTRAYTDAGYFGRNVRLVEVLIDREAIESGATVVDAPWMFYDLGHGYCTYDFFDQCPHRMACAKCAFYHPKAETQDQLRKARDNLQRMVQAIPLTEDEQRAVEEGLEAIERLCRRLADTPTPAGPTPRQLAIEA